MLVKLVEYRSRVDAVVMLYRRVVDRENFVKKVYHLLKADETKLLRSRLRPGLKVDFPEADYPGLAADFAKDDAENPAVLFMTELGQ